MVPPVSGCNDDVVVRSTMEQGWPLRFEIGNAKKTKTKQKLGRTSVNIDTTFIRVYKLVEESVHHIEPRYGRYCYRHVVWLKNLRVHLKHATSEQRVHQDMPHSTKLEMSDQ